MNSLLILLGLFTVGYGLQCPKCITTDFSDVSGVSEEIKALIGSSTGAECDTPEMITCDGSDMECATITLKVSYVMSSIDTIIENVSHLQKECMPRWATCSDMQDGFDYVNQMMDASVFIKLDECDIQSESGSEPGSESGPGSHTVSFPLTLAAALPLLALLL